MLVDIYRSQTYPNQFVAVPAGVQPSAVQLSDFPGLAPLTSHSSGVDLQPGKPRIGLDADDVIKQIGTNGYAVFGAEVTISRSTQPGQ